MYIIKITGKAFPFKKLVGYWAIALILCAENHQFEVSENKYVKVHAVEAWTVPTYLLTGFMVVPQDRISGMVPPSFYAAIYDSHRTFDRRRTTAARALGGVACQEVVLRQDKYLQDFQARKHRYRFTAAHLQSASLQLLPVLFLPPRFRSVIYWLHFSDI